MVFEQLDSHKRSRCDDGRHLGDAVAKRKRIAMLVPRVAVVGLLDFGTIASRCRRSPSLTGCSDFDQLTVLASAVRHDKQVKHHRPLRDEQRESDEQNLPRPL